MAEMGSGWVRCEAIMHRIAGEVSSEDAIEAMTIWESLGVIAMSADKQCVKLLKVV